METQNEEWRAIEEFPNYMVSSYGRVMRIKNASGTHKGKIIKQTNEKYRSVTLVPSDKSKAIKVLVHRLVLKAFTKLSPNGHSLETNHKDGDKHNNRMENLEWVTPSQNRIHAYENGLKSSRNSEDHQISKLRNGEVWLIRKLLHHKVKGVFLAKMFKVSKGTIYGIKHKQRYLANNAIYDGGIL